MFAIIEEKIDFEDKLQEKNCTNSQDKLMYKLYNYKSLNKSQKILYKVAKNSNFAIKNHINEEKISKIAKEFPNIQRKKSKSQIIENIPNEFEKERENITCFIENEAILNNFNKNEQRISFSTTDNSNINKKNEISSMNDHFWSKILTADLRDNSQLCDSLFEPKNMVSLKNFMEISKKNQPKNPKISFNHKIYREKSEDYRPKVLTSRECIEF